MTTTAVSGYSDQAYEYAKKYNTTSSKTMQTQSTDSLLFTTDSSTDYAVSNTTGNTCTDGYDDGKIGVFGCIGSALKGIGKGIISGVKGMFTDDQGNFSIGKTLKTAAMTAVCFIPTIGPAIGLAMAAKGVASGVSTIVSGVANAASATTDAAKKDALENIGSGTFTTALSAVGAKACATNLAGSLGIGSAASKLSGNAAKACGNAEGSAAAGLSEAGQYINAFKSGIGNGFKCLWQGTKDNAVGAASAIGKKASDTYNNVKNGINKARADIATNGFGNTMKAYAKSAGTALKNKTVGRFFRKNTEVDTFKNNELKDAKFSKNPDGKMTADIKIGNETYKVEQLSGNSYKYTSADGQTTYFCNKNGVVTKTVTGNITKEYGWGGNKKLEYTEVDGKQTTIFERHRKFGLSKQYTETTTDSNGNTTVTVKDKAGHGISSVTKNAKGEVQLSKTQSDLISSTNPLNVLEKYENGVPKTVNAVDGKLTEYNQYGQPIKITNKITGEVQEFSYNNTIDATPYKTVTSNYNGDSLVSRTIDCKGFNGEASNSYHEFTDYTGDKAATTRTTTIDGKTYTTGGATAGEAFDNFVGNLRGKVGTSPLLKGGVSLASSPIKMATGIGGKIIPDSWYTEIGSTGTTTSDLWAYGTTLADEENPYQNPFGY